MDKKSKILYLKAEMTHSMLRSFEGLYRVIAINENRLFPELAKVVVTSFDLDFETLYGFYNIDKDGIETNQIITGNGSSDYEGHAMNAVTIGDVFRENKSKASFLYGEKNEWRFSIELIKIIEGCDKIKLPAIVQSCGEIPPPIDEFVYHS